MRSHIFESNVEVVDQWSLLSRVGRVRCTSWGGRASASVERVVNTAGKEVLATIFTRVNCLRVVRMDIVDLAHKTRSYLGRGTHEFSVVANVLPVFVIALDRAICLGYM